ncbi:MAG: GTP 3',8-cyclase MoaA [Bacteroidetes bacterium]|nr:GTP 3',8-cyclase MoaA [Bacteroidota bacterium]
MITDSHGRHINYLRLAVTDRCNLRCAYCMPEEGLKWLQRSELLSYEEMLRLCRILVKEGIEKIRITGGEPFARKDIMGFLEALSQVEGLKELSITTNGVLTAPFVPELKRIGVKAINLSLDTLDKQRFYDITRRDELERVMDTLTALLQHEIEVKVNAVVMARRNTMDIIPMAELTKDNHVDVRFIEEMPFNGAGKQYEALEWDHVRILDEIRSRYPNIHKVKDAPHSTSYNYCIPGHKGNVGIIAAYTRSFCGTCNRIRITPHGRLKTCLYDEGVFDVRALLRSGMEDEAIAGALVAAVKGKAVDGWEAEHTRHAGNLVSESMATIGG